MPSFLAENLKDLEGIVLYLQQKILFPTVVLLQGELGTGKTALTKVLAEKYGLSSRKIKSPTFTLLNSYLTRDQLEFHHIDLYRVKNIDQFYEENLKEIFTQKNILVIIEWPHDILKLLEHWKDLKKIQVKIEYLDDNKRKFSIEEL